MTEHWIEAHQAKEIAGSSHSLCERLRDGLIASRAETFVRHDQALSAALLPKEFWWAGGYDALEQDWAAGQFSTWIDRAFHWKAYGVQMALSGVLEMLPFNDRAVTARALSVAGDVGWISARAAKQFAYDKAGAIPMKAGAAIIVQARLGFITARAVTATCFRGGRDDTAPQWEEREWDVPTWFWDRFADPDSSAQDWELGTFSGKGVGPEGLRYFTLRDVRFMRASLDALLPSTLLAPPILPAKSGGRPPAAFADDLMCAIWASIYRGDLQPKRQADVERAILDWTAAEGHVLGNTAAREKARKIWTATRQEVENPAA